MDILVLGHRGQGAAGSRARAGAGSVTARCTQSAACPVITARSNLLIAANHPKTDKTERKIDQ